ncbi:MAG: hypothetical protein LBC41_11950 [Clostridiales bacterium]|jgi:hypothetical protein|nr:hypothetical protein [Clostridiales bacterium]
MLEALASMKISFPTRRKKEVPSFEFKQIQPMDQDTYSDLLENAIEEMKAKQQEKFLRRRQAELANATAD